MQRFILIALLTALAGCSSKVGEVGFNRYIIETPYGDDIPYADAVATLTDEALGICDGEYRKVNDYDTAQGSKRLLVWEVGCLGAERTDTRFGWVGYGRSDGRRN